MKTNKYKTVEGILFIEAELPPKSEKIMSSNKGANATREFKKAIIKSTFDEEKFPIDSIWMMSDVPPQKVSFFGEEILIIQEKDLYARID